MVKDTSLQTSPQLALVEQQGVVVVLSTKQVVSLFKKSEQSGIPFDTLREVYQRGYSQSLSEQIAYNRVNSFIAGGAAMEIDQDLLEKRGLWDNIHAKKERIKHGSGEHMRKPGSKGAPTNAALKASQNEDADPCWDNYKQVGMKKKNGKPVPNCVPKEGYTGTIKRVIKEHCGCDKEKKMVEDAKGYKNPTGGLTQKGRDHYNRESGGNLKAPVTTAPSKLKAGSKSANRRKSFCARMSGVEGPMKKPNGEPTRKALALRKWNC